MATPDKRLALQAGLGPALPYHEATKHHPHRYARSLGYMDWANQPNPFRRYAGAPLFLLPFPESDDSPAFDRLYAPRGIPSRPVDALSIGEFFECALGLSAWKEYRGTRWELRCNPSSGNLHPTEGYLISDFAGPPAVYHYAPKEHGLERRCVFAESAWRALRAGFPEGAHFVGLASVQWREIWKYGERAYRYCNHDVGHAVAALSCSGAALGWRVALLDALSDEDVAALLGLDREQDRRAAEIEHPDLLAAVAPANHAAAIPNGLWMDEDGRTRTDTDVAAVVRAVAGAVWTGAANRLSADHVPWDIIETVTTACRKPRTGMRGYAPPQAGSGGEAAPASGPSARRIFQQRRSAVDMDGATGISAAAFYRILERTMPDAARPPWWSVAPEPRIHLGLFVHRVTGLPLGLYLLARDPGEVGALREAMRGRSGQAGTPWLWKKPEDAPAALPLFCLDTGDYRRAATEASCHQDIAGDGAFCVTMFARMDDRAADSPGGPRRYPRLFWEAGMVGQVLYLEAERAGVRGTGIGCYFDDVVHACFGLRDQQYQSLYHFTIGGPVEDPRLRSLPPYKRDRRETPAGVIESS